MPEDIPTTTPPAEPDASTAPDTTPAASGGPEPQVVPQGATVADTPETSGKDDATVDKDKVIATVRRENAKWREKVRALETQVTGIAKALNPDAPDDKPDPDRVIGQLAAQQRENRVLRLAPGLGANADALLDSRRFTAAIEQIDPASDDAEAAITQAITDAMEKDPRIRVEAPKTPPPKAGAGQHHGGHQTPPPKSLSEAVASRYGA